MQSFDVFISYRRENGAEIARLIKEKLERAGFSVFLDIDDLREGAWNDELHNRINECTDFVPLITECFFDRCTDSADVVRREIELAIKADKNIVPILIADDPFPESIPPELLKVANYNGVRYVDEGVSKVIRMLKSGQLGLERLGSGELGPRRVVVISGLVLSVLHGSTVYYGGIETLIPSLVTRPVYAIISMIPIIGALFGASIAYKTDANKLYCGREWILFWICYVPVVAIIAFLSAYLAIAVLTLAFPPEDGGQISMLRLVGLAAAIGGVAIFQKILMKRELWRLPLNIGTTIT